MFSPIDDGLFTHNQTLTWIRHNPFKTATIVVGAAVIAIIASPAIVSGPVLAAGGFGSAGVGTGGAGIVILNTAVQFTGATAGLVGAWAVSRFSKTCVDN
ncbi:hypothetical protein B7463_g4719, partial [Scytalidium lignicola]